MAIGQGFVPLAAATLFATVGVLAATRRRFSLRDEGPGTACFRIVMIASRGKAGMKRGNPLIRLFLSIDLSLPS
ncbi:hypothetical protein [Azospirillum sp.]|uniref:hypothetical protein n=1 Tax=Azospirillum sp. TaxID=34012 RepID=UPI002623D8E8|nr:hypothetical protein [Azospirillum sp.]